MSKRKTLFDRYMTRQEVERPAGPIDAGYKTALTDVLSLIREAKR